MPLRSGERDELKILEHAHAQMAQRLGEQWQQLRQQDLQRRELVANISHDLRTPLSTLHGYLETMALKEATLSPDERRRYLGIALAQSAKVGRLARALFELARLEHGEVRLEWEVFALPELLQDVLQKFELAAQARGQHLHADFPPGLPLVRADLGLVERVLTNLLDNALRHAPEGGEVRVQLRAIEGSVEVSVADAGPGVAPALPWRVRAGGRRPGTRFHRGACRDPAARPSTCARPGARTAATAARPCPARSGWPGTRPRHRTACS